MYEFDAVIQKHDSMDAAYITFPYDVEKEFGTKGQVKVVATFDGYAYRGSLAKMGLPFHCLGLTQQVRKAIGKQPGDTVHVTVQRDLTPRIVEVPEDLQKLLAGNDLARTYFEGFSYSHQKEYVEWLGSAKKTETREKRLQKMIETLVSQTRKR